MLAVTSITSLNQGADLARWHMQQIYASSPTEMDQVVDEAAPVEAISDRSPRWHILVALLGSASLAVRLLGLWRPRHAMNGTAAR